MTARKVDSFLRIPAGRERHPRQYTRWTADEEQRILEMAQAGRTWGEIERVAGRTTASIWSHFQDQGHSIRELRRGVDGCRSVYEVGCLLGVYDQVVRRWVADGELPATRKRAAKRVRYVADLALVDWMADRRYWPDWSPEAIQDADWRAFAQELRTAAGGQWLGVEDVAARYHVSYSRACEWFRCGRLPNPYRRVRSWYVWSADLDDWRPPYATADYSEVNRRAWITRRAKKASCDEQASGK